MKLSNLGLYLNSDLGGDAAGFKSNTSYWYLSFNPLFHLPNAVPSTSLVVEPPAVAPIVICVANSGVMLVWKDMSLKKLDELSFVLYPNVFKNTSSPVTSGMGVSWWKLSSTIVIILSSFNIGFNLVVLASDEFIPPHMACKNLNNENLPSSSVFDS